MYIRSYSNTNSPTVAGYEKTGACEVSQEVETQESQLGFVSRQIQGISDRLSAGMVSRSKCPRDA